MPIGQDEAQIAELDTLRGGNPNSVLGDLAAVVREITARLM
jgi:hypothetical protein